MLYPSGFAEPESICLEFLNESVTYSRFNARKRLYEGLVDEIPFAPGHCLSTRILLGDPSTGSQRDFVAPSPFPDAVNLTRRSVFS